MRYTEDKGPSLHQGIILSSSLEERFRQLARYRGWTIEILAELENNDGLTVSQIADKLNHRKKDIRQYCYRLFESGFIEKIERWGYRITSAGRHLLFINDDNTNTTLTPHKDNTKTTLKQMTLSPYNDSRYTDPELSITNVIITHYNQTGQPFIFIESELDICELAQVNPEQLYEAMRRLYQDRVCYIYNNRKYGRQQLRLYKDFLERMKHI